MWKLYLNMVYLGLPLWSSGQSSWLHILRPRFDSRRCQIFWGVVGLERCPLSLVSTTEELLGRQSSGSGLEIREYGRRDPSRWPHGTLYPQNLGLTSPTSGSRSRTQAMEFTVYLSGIEIEITAVGDPPRWLTPLYPQKLALTSPTRSSRSVDLSV
jgi:hypothetical protein